MADLELAVLDGLGDVSLSARDREALHLRTLFGNERVADSRRRSARRARTGVQTAMMARRSSGGAG